MTMEMELTTRNQLRGSVKHVTVGSVMAEVVVDVHGRDVVAAITRHSVERLGLAAGDTVTALVKATEVMLAKGSSPIENLSTRNQLVGTVTGVETGSVMAEVRIEVGGDELVAAITRQSVDRLGLAAGDSVVVLVKATEVVLAK